MQIILYFISILSLVILALIAVRAKSNFILFMILVKPFLDITVNIKLVRGMNSLEISGIFIFIVTGALFLQLRYKKIVINLANIWIFIMYRFKAFADREGIVYNKKTGEKWQDFQRKK